MSRKFILSIAFVFSAMISFAQKGEVWPTLTRQEFEFNSAREITQEGQVGTYYSYYLFINNNEFIHCTETITSLYKVISRDEKEDFTDYTVVSEVGNTYTFRFGYKENYVAIYSDKGYGFYISTATPYATKVFDNINR